MELFSSEQMERLLELRNWLTRESEERIKQASSRRGYAGNPHATEAELKRDKKMAEKMFGRKLDLVSTKPEDNRRNCRAQENIANKLDNEARQLSAWAEDVRLMANSKQDGG